LTFGTIKAKRSTKVSGSFTTTEEVHYLTKGANRYEMSGGGGDRVPNDIMHAFGAVRKNSEKLDGAPLPTSTLEPIVILLIKP